MASPRGSEQSDPGQNIVLELLLLTSHSLLPSLGKASPFSESFLQLHLQVAGFLVWHRQEPQNLLFSLLDTAG